MKPVISICIPTYNRSRQLEQSIESIICQKEFVEGLVEIVISDNASTDNTETICKEYLELYSNFLYFKNEKNIANKNFPICISHASGKLRLLSNDTFLYYNGALGKLLEIEKINETEKPVIFLMNRKMSKKIYMKKRCNSLHEFALATTYLSTWSGSFTIWEEDCKEIETDCIS